MAPKRPLEGRDIRDADVANAPVGTGPFRFVEWRRGQYTRLDRNADYRKDGRPHLDRLVARVVPDASPRTAAMETGEAIYAGLGAIPNVDAVRLRDEPGFGVTTEGNGMINSTALVEFNSQVEPFDHPTMRRAVSQAIGRDVSIDDIFLGCGEAATRALSTEVSATGLHADGAPARVTLDLIP